MIRTDSVTEILESLDFEESKACESRHHLTHPRVHGGVATHLQIGSCPHMTGLRCEKYMSPRAAGVPLSEECKTCGVSGTPIFIPLN